jgi:hypothetical protein
MSDEAKPVEEEEHEEGEVSVSCDRCGLPRAENSVTVEGEVLEGRKTWVLCPSCARTVMAAIKG